MDICNTDIDLSATEEEAIKFYFRKGYEYNDILSMLSKYHDIKITYSTLLRRLRSYGLRRRGQMEYVDLEVVKRRITEMVTDNPSSSSGYRTIWHALQLEGINVPRLVVQKHLREIDPFGSARRKAHCLKRREYTSYGPNDSWHIDGYDKLKPWGFPIHGAIDGCSRKILWLCVIRSNNSPENILRLYISAVKEFGGCPRTLITDLGNENGLAASAQCFFQENDNSHRYVPSPRNQRIEAWWSQYSRQRSSWWREFFRSLESDGVLDLTSELHREALWYCFSPVIQDDLNSIRCQWNSHYIRRSRFDTIPGRPDILYDLPENYGAEDLKVEVTFEDIESIENNVLYENEEDHDLDIYTEYFEYVLSHFPLQKPTDWKESLFLYKLLIDHGQGEENED